MSNRIGKIFSNKILVYLFSRYFTYGLQFLTSLIIAVQLGPYYMGVWGFLLLILNYFQQAHFGISNSLNVLMVHYKDTPHQTSLYINNSLFLVSLVAIVALGLFGFLCGSNLNSFTKYGVDRYAVVLAIIIVLQYYNQLFLNIFRVKNKINYVTFSQSIIILLNFFPVFFFEGENLVMLLLFGNLVGGILSFISVIPSRVLPSIELKALRWSIQKEILSKGLLLFLFNTCNVFIIISTRTFVSGYYSVEEFGLFTFSFSFAHAMLLLLESISFIIFPKLIDKMSSNIEENVYKSVQDITSYYTTCSHLLIFFALLLFPLLIYCFPKYDKALSCLNITALTILMSSYSYGCGTLLIAKNKEKLSALSSLLALVANTVIAYLLINMLEVDFSRVILASMVSYFIMTFLFGCFGFRIMGKNMYEMVKANYPLRHVLPYIVGVTICLLELEYMIAIPLLLFLMMNKKQLNIVKELVFRVILNDKIFNV